MLKMFKKKLYMLGLLFSVPLHLVKWSHSPSPNYIEKLKRSYELKKMMCPLKVFPPPDYCLTLKSPFSLLKVTHTGKLISVPILHEFEAELPAVI